jgi:hypothetical protein
MAEELTGRERVVYQAAVDEALRLILRSQEHQIKLLVDALRGIADRCTIMADEELADELDNIWSPGHSL